MDDKIREYWNQAHHDRDLSKLTGTDLNGHLEFLKVSLPSEKQLLCIGVGNGGWVEEISEQAFRNFNTVWTLDIVHRIIAGVVSTTNPSLLPSNFFGLAMSLWVAPHMDDGSLSEQLQNVVRSLSIDGVLAIHYNEPLDPTQYIALACTQTMLAGTVLRTRETFNGMVEDAGGNSEVVNILPHLQYEMQMVAAHVRRRV